MALFKVGDEVRDMTYGVGMVTAVVLSAGVATAVTVKFRNARAPRTFTEGGAYALKRLMRAVQGEVSALAEAATGIVKPAATSVKKPVGPTWTQVINKLQAIKLPAGAAAQTQAVACAHDQLTFLVRRFGFNMLPKLDVLTAEETWHLLTQVFHDDEVLDALTRVLPSSHLPSGIVRVEQIQTTSPNVTHYKQLRERGLQKSELAQRYRTMRESLNVHREVSPTPIDGIGALGGARSAAGGRVAVGNPRTWSEVFTNIRVNALERSAARRAMMRLEYAVASGLLPAIETIQSKDELLMYLVQLFDQQKAGPLAKAFSDQEIISLIPHLPERLRYHEEAYKSTRILNEAGKTVYVGGKEAKGDIRTARRRIAAMDPHDPRLALRRGVSDALGLPAVEEMQKTAAQNMGKYFKYGWEQNSEGLRAVVRDVLKHHTNAPEQLFTAPDGGMPEGFAHYTDWGDYVADQFLHRNPNKELSLPGAYDFSSDTAFFPHGPEGVAMELSELQVRIPHLERAIAKCQEEARTASDPAIAAAANARASAYTQEIASAKERIATLRVLHANNIADQAPGKIASIAATYHDQILKALKDPATFADLSERLREDTPVERRITGLDYTSDARQIPVSILASQYKETVQEHFTSDQIMQNAPEAPIPGAPSFDIHDVKTARQPVLRSSVDVEGYIKFLTQSAESARTRLRREEAELASYLERGIPETHPSVQRQRARIRELNAYLAQNATDLRKFRGHLGHMRKAEREGRPVSPIDLNSSEREQADIALLEEGKRHMDTVQAKRAKEASAKNIVQETQLVKIHDLKVSAPVTGAPRSERRRLIRQLKAENVEAVRELGVFSREAQRHLGVIVDRLKARGVKQNTIDELVRYYNTNVGAKLRAAAQISTGGTLEHAKHTHEALEAFRDFYDGALRTFIRDLPGVGLEVLNTVAAAAPRFHELYKHIFINQHGVYKRLINLRAHVDPRMELMAVGGEFGRVAKVEVPVLRQIAQQLRKDVGEKTLMRQVNRVDKRIATLLAQPPKDPNVIATQLRNYAQEYDALIRQAQELSNAAYGTTGHTGLVTAAKLAGNEGYEHLYAGLRNTTDTTRLAAAAVHDRLGAAMPFGSVVASAQQFQETLQRNEHVVQRSILRGNRRVTVTANDLTRRLAQQYSGDLDRALEHLTTGMPQFSTTGVRDDKWKPIFGVRHDIGTQFYVEYQREVADILHGVRDADEFGLSFIGVDGTVRRATEQAIHEEALSRVSRLSPDTLLNAALRYETKQRVIADPIVEIEARITEWQRQHRGTPPVLAKNELAYLLRAMTGSELSAESADSRAVWERIVQQYLPEGVRDGVTVGRKISEAVLAHNRAKSLELSVARARGYHTALRKAAANETLTTEEFRYLRATVAKLNTEADKLLADYKRAMYANPVVRDVTTVSMREISWKKASTVLYDIETRLDLMRKRGDTAGARQLELLLKDARAKLQRAVDLRKLASDLQHRRVSSAQDPLFEEVLNTHRTVITRGEAQLTKETQAALAGVAQSGAEIAARQRNAAERAVLRMLGPQLRAAAQNPREHQLAVQIYTAFFGESATKLLSGEIAREQALGESAEHLAKPKNFAKPDEMDDDYIDREVDGVHARRIEGMTRIDPLSPEGQGLTHDYSVVRYLEGHGGKMTATVELPNGARRELRVKRTESRRGQVLYILDYDGQEVIASASGQALLSISEAKDVITPATRELLKPDAPVTRTILPTQPVLRNGVLTSQIDGALIGERDLARLQEARAAGGSYMAMDIETLMGRPYSIAPAFGTFGSGTEATSPGEAYIRMDDEAYREAKRLLTTQVTNPNDLESLAYLKKGLADLAKSEGGYLNALEYIQEHGMTPHELGEYLERHTRGVQLTASHGSYDLQRLRALGVDERIIDEIAAKHVNTVALTHYQEGVAIAQERLMSSAEAHTSQADALALANEVLPTYARTPSPFNENVALDRAVLIHNRNKRTYTWDGQIRHETSPTGEQFFADLQPLHQEGIDATRDLKGLSVSSGSVESLMNELNFTFMPLKNAEDAAKERTAILLDIGARRYRRDTVRYIQQDREIADFMDSIKGLSDTERESAINAELQRLAEETRAASADVRGVQAQVDQLKRLHALREERRALGRELIEIRHKRTIGAYGLEETNREVAIRQRRREIGADLATHNVTVARDLGAEVASAERVLNTHRRRILRTERVHNRLQTLVDDFGMSSLPEQFASSPDWYGKVFGDGTNEVAAFYDWLDDLEAQGAAQEHVEAAVQELWGRARQADVMPRRGREATDLARSEQHAEVSINLPIEKYREDFARAEEGLTRAQAAMAGSTAPEVAGAYERAQQTYMNALEQYMPTQRVRLDTSSEAALERSLRTAARRHHRSLLDEHNMEASPEEVYRRVVNSVSRGLGVEGIPNQQTHLTNLLTAARAQHAPYYDMHAIAQDPERLFNLEFTALQLREQLENGGLELAWEMLDIRKGFESINDLLERANRLPAGAEERERLLALAQSRWQQTAPTTYMLGDGDSRTVLYQRHDPILNAREFEGVVPREVDPIEHRAYAQLMEEFGWGPTNAPTAMGADGRRIPQPPRVGPPPAPVDVDALLAKPEIIAKERTLPGFADTAIPDLAVPTLGDVAGLAMGAGELALRMASGSVAAIIGGISSVATAGAALAGTAVAMLGFHHPNLKSGEEREGNVIVPDYRERHRRVPVVTSSMEQPYKYVVDVRGTASGTDHNTLAAMVHRVMDNHIGGLTAAFDERDMRRKADRTWIRDLARGVY